MFQDMVRFPVVVSFDYDPGADDILPVYRAPAKATIRSAFVTVANDVAASTADWFRVRLVKINASGTAAITDWAGGTAGWTGLSPVQFNVTSDELAAGDLLALEYDENGTGTFGQMTVQADVVFGS